jgi:16S rRNA (cytosine1402-N4)-methyltransferase
MLPAVNAKESRLNPAVPHHPALLSETLELLALKPGMTVVDATVGTGGHSEAILQVIAPQGRLYGIDRDLRAIDLARSRLAAFGDSFIPIHGNHFDVVDLLSGAGIQSVDGVLADLGVSSMQLDDPERGFSFAGDGPLDMRMDQSSGHTAAMLLADIPEEELREILWIYGEEQMAGAIARAIVRERADRPLRTTGRLAQLVARVMGPRARSMRINPATRTFQALRCAVNREIDGLGRFVEDAVGLLESGGRIAAISYHSLEDRAVKRSLAAMADSCVCPPRLPVCGCGRVNLIRILTSKPVRPSLGEISRNRRSRSAKLRAAERL